MRVAEGGVAGPALPSCVRAREFLVNRACVRAHGEEQAGRALNKSPFGGGVSRSFARAPSVRMTSGETICDSVLLAKFAQSLVTTDTLGSGNCHFIHHFLLVSLCGHAQLCGS